MSAVARDAESGARAPNFLALPGAVGDDHAGVVTAGHSWQRRVERTGDRLHVARVYVRRVDLNEHLTRAGLGNGYFLLEQDRRYTVRFEADGFHVEQYT